MLASRPSPKTVPFSAGVLYGLASQCLEFYQGYIYIVILTRSRYANH